MNKSASAKNSVRPIRWKRWSLAVFAGTILLGFTLPEKLVIPVRNATRKDWNRQSFWYEPWGKSGVHKGIDIFAPEGREVLAATGGLVVWRGGHGRQGGGCVRPQVALPLLRAPARLPDALAFGCKQRPAHRLRGHQRKCRRKTTPPALFHFHFGAISVALGQQHARCAEDVLSESRYFVAVRFGVFERYCFSHRGFMPDRKRFFRPAENKKPLPRVGGSGF